MHVVNIKRMDTQKEGMCKLSPEMQKRILEAVRITRPYYGLYGRRMSIAEGESSDDVKS